MSVLLAVLLALAPPTIAAVPPADPPPGADPARGPIWGPVAGPVGYVWPVAPARLTRRFEPPPLPWLPGHRGVDLAASPATVVRSAGAGTVVFAGQVAGRGVVSVAHAGGLRTTYEPLAVARLHAGDRVPAGRPLGTLVAGHPGCPATACLHWGLRHGERYLDPLALLGRGRVRLLPRPGVPRR
ncbi:murein hydrolase activator EnvC family protein [Mangrovihabitans endophyticus]|nr:M23 family metallopeptidase [Mangrovihabitans endophyticus]